ncbi:MAG TPA: alpha/beta fold hydrolase [Alphaproteobacteria bacterium]|nr:alpha/beta fold hydrolase [Alphaproteobacteria bacterium]
MDYEIFDLGDIGLQSGLTLASAKLAYKAYGTLAPAKDNVILYATRFSGRHYENEFLIGPGKALDPSKYFILIPNTFGNSLSSSPANTPAPQNKARFPTITYWDNVHAQRRLLRERFGIERLKLVLGWSMGAQMAYHWAALFPEEVERMGCICGSARTSRHNYVFLDGVKSALTADAAWNGGWYDAPPVVGLKAMAHVYAGWAFSQAFYRRRLYETLGYSSVEDFLIRYWEGSFLQRDANNMLSLVWTWQHGDISANDAYRGDFEKALRAIKARALVMPCRTDLYFPPEDNEYEASQLKDGELVVIDSDYGHMAAGDKDPADTGFIDQKLKELLAR